MKNIQIRPSQFITTYGVGSIIDGPNGSSIILDFNKADIFPDNKPPADAFKIAILGASRLAKRLAYGNDEYAAKDIGIFRLPTNADFPVGDDDPIYAVNRFPNWSLCHHSHTGGYQVLYRRDNRIGDKRGVCPICINKDPSIPSWKSNEQVIRFVRACPKGHIDDVDWYFEIHKTFSKSKSAECKEQDYYEYFDAGSELKFVRIRCPKCKKSTTLQKIMNHEYKCTGRLPFQDGSLNSMKGGFGKEACYSNFRVIQRTASSLFVPQVITSISLPEEANSFYPLLNFPFIYAELLLYHKNHSRSMTFDDVYKKFESWMQIDLIVNNNPALFELFKILDKINKDPSQKAIADSIIKYFVEDILTSETLYDEYKLRIDEYKAFRDRRPGLEIDKSLEFGSPINFSYQGPRNTIKFKITPIIQLETIMIQQGFYRYIKVEKRKRISSEPIKSDEIENEENLLFPTPYKDRDDKYWFVGARLKGEGIFIELDDDTELKFNEQDYEFWESVSNDIKTLITLSKEEDLSQITEIKERIPIPKKRRDWLEIFKRRGFHIFTNPLGIWWHTLAHRLIKALGLDCGYSSASLRERLYLNLEEMKGGVLIYANRPGEDGTLGGLVSQAQRFDEILKLALDDIDSCSNDPICLLKRFKEFSVNGACCYVCGFLSETSCEFGNIGLDRNIIVDTL